MGPCLTERLVAAERTGTTARVVAMDATLYEVLGVAPDATQDEIKAAYRRLVLQVHPDAGGNDALFRQVKEAYDTLVDPRLRQAYDAALRDRSTRNHAGEHQGSQPHFDPESDAEWTEVHDTRFDDPFSPPGSAPRHNGPAASGRTSSPAQSSSPELAGAICGVLIACAWIWEASTVITPNWASDLLSLGLIGAGAGALAAPALVRRHGVAGSLGIASVLAVAPVVVVAVLAFGVLSSLLSSMTRRSR